MQIEAFSTKRFAVHDWRPMIHHEAARKNVEASLTAILSPPVLAHLPPSLQLERRKGAVSSWITARAAESEVLIVTSKSDRCMIGLVIIAPSSDPGPRLVIHIGYLLAEPAWGQGAASEILNGLVSALQHVAPARLVGGVDIDNPASARVLQKAGFDRDPDLSTPQSEIYTLDID